VRLGPSGEVSRVVLFDIETSGLDAWNDRVLSVCFFDSDVPSSVFVVRGDDETQIFRYLLDGPWRALVERDWPDALSISFNGLRFDVPFLTFRFLRTLGPGQDAWVFQSRLRRTHLDLKQFAFLEVGRWGACSLGDLVPGYPNPEWRVVGSKPPWIGVSSIDPDIWEYMARYQFEEMKALIRYVQRCFSRFPKLFFPLLMVDPDRLVLQVVDCFA